MAVVVLVEASNFNVLPLQTGLLLLTVGVAGAGGSCRVYGPMVLEVHPVRDTVRSSYVAALRLDSCRVPAALDVRVAVNVAPFLV